MRKIFTLCLVAVAAMFANKVYADNIKGSDNVLTVHVGNSDDKAKIPVSVYLANPTTSITSVEVNLKAPIAPTNFGEYDEDEGDYIFETADKDRFTSSHTATIAAGTKENPDALFISITSSKTTNLKGTEGKVITVFLNGSELAAGTYTIDMVGNLAIWSDKKTTAIYESEDTSDTFTIGEDGKVTAVQGITAEEIAKAKGVFTLDGKKVAAPQKGQIYVVDGKTVKF